MAYTDALHYATAKTESILLLTIDYNFIEFLGKRGYIVEGPVYTPEELVEIEHSSPKSNSAPKTASSF